ncbi:MAG TPA: gamma-glutamylcyclotransferase family protein [Sphingomicrobium sp.]|nr:gamma-glutamylcyclotransferase family protein [Sphingomicrobium sp.]
MPATVPLFSYGTLQQREVQLATYGRQLEGSTDALRGYRLIPLKIDDPAVIRTSGKAVHKIARATGDAADRIAGQLFLLTEEELAKTDGYEVEDYQRVEVRLESGRTAFAYVGPPTAGALKARA